MSVAAQPYLDPALAVADRVDDLLGRMTVEEKLAQLGSIWVFEVLDADRLDRGKAQERLGTGIGQITRVAGATSFAMPAVAALANEIQRFLVERTRLGIPAIVHEECLHGLVARDAVCFPQSIGLAAAWDPELLEALASSFARQLRAMGAHQGLAPIFDVARDPRWGRIEETYGEDPYLIAALGVAYVRGLQEGAEAPVLATGKHMVGHGLPEGGMNRAPAHIGARELRDVYLWPFEAAVREAGMRSMMHAYEDVDGVPCVASRELFTTTLRDEWGFDGIVVSDYAGIDELVESHAIVGDLGAAAALALEAGIDVELPSTAAFGAPLAQALAAGDVDPALVDRAVARVLAVKFELGLFEAPYVDAAGAHPPLEADRALARDAARASIVLLENDGTLPLRDDLATIAVIGPNADTARNLLGDYAHVAHVETLLEMRDNPIGFPVPDDLEPVRRARRPLHDPRRRARALPGGHGGPLRGGRGRPRRKRRRDRRGGRRRAGSGRRDRRRRRALGADARVHVRGDARPHGARAPGPPGGARRGGGRDRRAGRARPGGRPSAGHPGGGRECGGRGQRVGARRRGARGDRGDPLRRRRPGRQAPGHGAPSCRAGPDLLRAQAVGRALALARRLRRRLAPAAVALRPRTLLYALRAARPRARPHRVALALGDEVAIAVEVENVGERAGDEVVQLYVRDEEASVTRPVKELRGFRRVHLAAGERRRVTFRLAAEQLAFTGLDGRLVLEPGRVRVMVGTSSADLPCQADLELTGDTAVLARRSRYITEVAVD